MCIINITYIVSLLFLKVALSTALFLHFTIIYNDHPTWEAFLESATLEEIYLWLKTQSNIHMYNIPSQHSSQHAGYMFIRW